MNHGLCRRIILDKMPNWWEYASLMSNMDDFKSVTGLV